MNMEKTYDALIDRLARSAAWHSAIAADMEKMPDLCEYERERIAYDKAVADFLQKVLGAEAKT